MRCLPPPKNGFDSINASDPYQGFDYSHGFNAHQQNTSFHSTPTPPTNGLYTQPHHQDPAQQLHASGSLAQAAATNGIGHGSSEAVKSDPGDGDLSPGHGGTGSGDGDDDESMTPAQSRRKAQNRAAYVNRRLMALLPVTLRPHSGPPSWAYTLSMAHVADSLPI